MVLPFNLNRLGGIKKQGYTPLKYLESTGTQYIDTGIDFNENTSVEISFAFVNQEITGAKHLIGAQVTSPAARYNPLYCTVVDNVPKIRTLLDIDGTQSITRDFDTNIHVLEFNRYPDKKVVYDGVVDGTVSSIGTGNSINLFRRNLRNNWAYANGRIYATRIRQSGVLVCDLIPVLDKNGTPCMCDRVSKNLFYNQGTGDFLYEEWDYTPVDCVYANGNAYTSTMLSGNSDTKMEMVFDITAQSTQNRGSMGSRGSSANSQLLAIGYGTTTLASDFNNSSYSPYRSYIIYELNKKYRVYTSKEKRSIIDEATGTVLAENNTLCTNNMSTGALLLGAETGLSYRHIGNIYGARIWDGATLIRDYIPVVDGDNKGGFYDKCLNIISYSSGSSDFVGHFIENGVNYKVVKNIESTGTQYIDTGLYPTNNHSVEIDYRFVQTPSVGERVGLFGTLTAQTSPVKNPRYGDLVSPTTNKLEYGYGINNAYYQTGTPDTNRHVIKHDKNKLYVDGVLVNTFDSDAFSCATTAYLFNFNYTNYTPALSKYYKSKWWDGNKLIRHYIPVLRESNNEPGMFDAVNKQFYENAGTGTFNYEEV